MKVFSAVETTCFSGVSIPYRRNESFLSHAVISTTCSFQFLIGAMKVLRFLMTIKPITLFQFLIGAMKVEHYTWPWPQQFVSIPYRRNERYQIVPSSLIVTEFQFLIGAMKDGDAIVYGDAIVSFQFLIGAMKGGWIENESNLSQSFQFLIGAMKVSPHILACLALLCFNSL